MNSLDDNTGLTGSVIIPGGAHVTLQQGLNWIAFENASSEDLTGTAQFQRDWGFEIGAAENLLLAMEELETGRENPVVSAAIWATRGRSYVRELQAKYNKTLPQPYLRTAIRLRADEVARKQHAVGSATSAIIEHAAAGRITVLACESLPPDPAAGRWSAKATGPAFALDPAVFATPGLVMSPFTGLVFPRHAGFLNLQIRTDGLLELWPALPGTRKRGRPSSKELIVAEARNRAAAGLTLPTMVAEARHLASWLLASHPDADSHPEPKTIQGHIGQILRKLPKSGNL